MELVWKNRVFDENWRYPRKKANGTGDQESSTFEGTGLRFHRWL